MRCKYAADDHDNVSPNIQIDNRNEVSKEENALKNKSDMKGRRNFRSAQVEVANSIGNQNLQNVSYESNQIL